MPKCDASRICRRSPPAENTQKKLPHLRQSASAGFDIENSPPNRMVVAVHGLLIVKRDQTRLELIISKTAYLSEVDATWGRLPYLVNYAH